MDTDKGYYTYGNYIGYVGKGVPGADRNGNMKFESERAYDEYVEELRGDADENISG